MAKQRRSAGPAAVMHLAKPHWQATRRMRLLATRRALLQAKSQATPRALLPVDSRAKAMLLVQPAKPQLLEPQD